MAAADLSAYLTASRQDREEEEEEEEVAAGGTKGGREGQWLQGWDKQYGCHFYHNTRTGRSQWTQPDEPFVPCESGVDGARTTTTTTTAATAATAAAATTTFRTARSSLSNSSRNSSSLRRSKTVTFSPRLVTVELDD